MYICYFQITEQLCDVYGEVMHTLMVYSRQACAPCHQVSSYEIEILISFIFVK